MRRHACVSESSNGAPSACFLPAWLYSSPVAVALLAPEARIRVDECQHRGALAHCSTIVCFLLLHGASWQATILVDISFKALPRGDACRELISCSIYVKLGLL